MAALTQQRFLELQNWFYAAERNGILSHKVSELGAGVSGINAPSANELAEFKRVATLFSSNTSNGTDNGASIDRGSFAGAGSIRGGLASYQAINRLKPSGLMDADTWQSLANAQGKPQPDFNPDLRQRVDHARTEYKKVIETARTTTARALVDAHGLWVQARNAAADKRLEEAKKLLDPNARAAAEREAGQLRPTGLLAEPSVPISAARIESNVGDPRLLESARYHGVLQISDKEGWFSEAAIQKKTAERLNQMAAAAGKNADPKLKGEWTQERVLAAYTRNEYVQTAAYMENMAKTAANREAIKPGELEKRLSDSYLGHLLPAGKTIIKDNPDSPKGLYALAMEKFANNPKYANDPKKMEEVRKTWANYMIGNSGIFMKQAKAFLDDPTKPPPNEWMKNNFSQYTNKQLSTAALRGTLPATPSVLASDTPRQILANAGRLISGGISEFANFIEQARPKTTPAAKPLAKPGKNQEEPTWMSVLKNLM